MQANALRYPANRHRLDIDVEFEKQALQHRILHAQVQSSTHTPMKAFDAYGICSRQLAFALHRHRM